MPSQSISLATVVVRTSRSAGQVKVSCIRPIGALLSAQSQYCVRAPCIWAAWSCCLGVSEVPKSCLTSASALRLLRKSG